ncbi:clostripain-related cysteine peptidase [Sorangium sp. So ce726]|uniref:clostripain-related cysteine peptidase n=1 Tax=Sorangium sp. So ce726 TaxID=3133319 RepID=UPI003F6211A4
MNRTDLTVSRRYPLLTAYLPLAALAAMTAGCTINEGGAPQRTLDEPPATWTIFVYGHGDHSLSLSLVNDIQEMSGADLTEDVHVVVAADFNASMALDESGQTFPEGTQWLRIAGNGAMEEDLGVDPEQNLDDPAVLAGAVQKAFERYPATRHGLILWDHGGSWDGGFGGDTQNGTAEPKGMDPASVARAVREGLEGAGLTGARPLDFVSFDTCLMASTEVAFELRDVAQTYIANAELDYGDGWDYTETLSYIARHPDASMTDIAVSEVALWNKHHENSGQLMDTLLRSHAAVDLTRYDAYVDALKHVATVLQEKPDLASEAARASFFSLPSYGFSAPTPVDDPSGTFHRDGGQFFRALEASSDPTLADAAKRARQALEDAILDTSQGSLRTTTQEAGWQITLPSFATYLSPPADSPASPSLSDIYQERTQRFQEAVPWGAMLDAVAVANDGQAPSFSLTSDATTDPKGLPTLQIKITDPDAASALLFVARQDEETGALIRYGAVASGTVENDGEYPFEWDGELLAIGEGENAQPVYVKKGPSLGVDPRTGETAPDLFVILGRLSAPEQEDALPCALLVEQGSERATMAVVEEAGNPAALEIRALRELLPDAQFTPILASEDPATGALSPVSGKPMTLDDDFVTLGSMPAPVGTYQFRLEVRDVFDNVGSSKVEVTVAAP